MEIMEILNFIKEYGNYKFAVNRWGSCQYSDALALFDGYNNLRKNHAKEIVLEYFNRELGIQISFSGIRDFDAALALIQKEAVDFFLDSWDGVSELDEYNQSLRDDAKELGRATSVSEIFSIRKESCADLWSMASIVANAFFIDLEIDNKSMRDEMLWFQMETGLYCALLMDYGIVLSEDDFKNFDT
jgi:hypothetical protein